MNAEQFFYLLFLPPLLAVIRASSRTLWLADLPPLILVPPVRLVEPAGFPASPLFDAERR